MFGHMSVFGGIALIICAVALLRFVSARADRRPVEREAVDRLYQRLAEVERRLTDVQDIVLSIDEKLERETDSTPADSGR